MKLIVGLGNPGKKYDKTRHNVGFMVIDSYLERSGEKLKLDMKFDAEICQTLVHNEKVIFLKPTTYMNLSGQAVFKIMQYFDIAIEDVLVFVDDVNLDIGKLRLRPFGGHGGHNGLRNINSHLKTNQYKRVRIGVGNDTTLPLEHHVLGTFNKEEAITIELAVINCLKIIDEYVNKKPFSDIMTTYNTQT